MQEELRQDKGPIRLLLSGFPHHIARVSGVLKAYWGAKGPDKSSLPFFRVKKLPFPPSASVDLDGLIP